MKVEIEPGKYVVAVSGGVDSMVLLDVLYRQPGIELVVAHFEHGVRADSDEDRKLAEETAKRYGLPFVYERGHLGEGASEAKAREARYAFLKKVQQEQGAKAIVTAHHQDDVIETAILNVRRGTGRKGLSSLRSAGEVVRPLLHIPKETIVAYAKDHNIAWHEDSTNASDEYARNYIRHHVLPRLGDDGRRQLYAHIEKASELNPDIDDLLQRDLQEHIVNDELNRAWFIMLPHDVACETMAAWLRMHEIREFDRRTIDRLVIASKVAQPGKVIDVNAAYVLNVSKTTLKITPRSSS